MPGIGPGVMLICLILNETCWSTVLRMRTTTSPSFIFFFTGLAHRWLRFSFKAASVAKFDKAAEVDATPVAGGWV